jgi:LEA14-like dessication related protein
MHLLHEPTVTLVSAAIKTVTLSSLEIDVIIRIENPNFFGVTVREAAFSFRCGQGSDGKEIAHGKTSRIRIPAKGSTVVMVPVTSHNLPLIHTLMSLLGSGSIGLAITGTATIDYFLGTWAVPFAKDLTIRTGEVAAAIGERIGKKD